jgi:Na+-transporting methylmalonyl-CoA/oxaloacetate decarboxylase gamma subunit
MANKETMLIIRIMGLIGAIFCLIAQFVPWGGGLYLFGLDIFGNWDFFYITIISSGAWQAILLGVVMIILFFINLITLILAFLSFKNFASKGSNAFLKLGIIATVEFILYIVAVSVASGGAAGFAAYGIGFVMILLAMIMFYITYGLGKALGATATPGMYQQPIYQQPTHTQAPTQYYTQQHAPPPQYQAPPPVQQPVSSEIKTKTKFCPACGTELQTNARFCPECGNQL